MRDQVRAPTRITIIDESELFRRGLAQLLGVEADLEVVGESASLDDFVGQISTGCPDVLVVDAEMIAKAGPEQLSRLRNLAPTMRVAALTAQVEPRAARALLAAGVHAYVSKNARHQELLTAIRTLRLEPDRVILSVSRQTFNVLSARREILSEREMEVLTLVGDGMSNIEIADTLFIAKGTVKRHLTNIYAKLGTKSRVGAVRKAASIGLLRWPWLGVRPGPVGTSRDGVW